MKKQLDIEQLISLSIEHIKKIYELTHNDASSGIIDWEHFVNHYKKTSILGFWNRFIHTLDIPTLQEILIKDYNLNIDISGAVTSVELYTADDNCFEIRCPEQIDALFEAVKFILEMV